MSVVGEPPSAGTCFKPALFHMPPKTTVPDASHTPNVHRLPAIFSTSVTGLPPESAIFFSSPSLVKNATDCPSGEKNGW